MAVVEKILLIEDDDLLRKVISEVLASKGFTVSACLRISEAKAALKENTFDLIISDIGLPDGNGLDFCADFNQIPFICMSAMDCAQQASANGAAAFIEKPFNTDDLIDAICQC